MDAPILTLLAADPGAHPRGGPGADDAAEALRRAALEVLRATARTHGGREVGRPGGGLMMAFTSAAAAVRCAARMQRGLAEAGISAARIGVAAGEPIRDGDDLRGTPVLLADGLCAAAEPGAVLVTEVVRQVAAPRVAEVLRPAGAVRVPGIPDRVAVVELVWRPEQAAPPAAAAPPRAISVVVADDQRLVRAGFRVILEAESDMRVVGEAEDGASAVEEVRRRRPDVVLMDIRMPGMDGLEAAERILADPALPTAVVMLTTFDRDEYVYEALRVGASGFLLKDTPADRLLDAVRVAAGGDALLAPSITRRLIARFARAARPAPGGVPPALAALTPRELEVLRLVARGLSNGEIAAALVLGENTIRTHVAHILAKLGLRDRVQAVVVAYETGLVARDGGDGDA
ncbi:MAG TPA: response regulator [Miltoncostaeaceae bacterium]|nr:response regulator [Miltoncostaeaceae bacterium]